MKQMTMTEMSAAFWMRADISAGSGVPVAVLGFNVLAMAAGGSAPIPSLLPFLYKHWVNDKPQTGGARYQELVLDM
jgi:hypothetical protein